MITMQILFKITLQYLRLVLSSRQIILTIRPLTLDVRCVNCIGGDAIRDKLGQAFSKRVILKFSIYILILRFRNNIHTENCWRDTRMICKFLSR